MKKGESCYHRRSRQEIVSKDFHLHVELHTEDQGSKYICAPAELSVILPTPSSET